MSNENTNKREFLVVVNNEEQYSVWFADRDLPPGWRAEGMRGTRDDCLAHIDRTWTDMRPRSVREHVAAHRG